MPLNWLGERHTERRDRVVIDTGVLVSAFVFGGIPEKAVMKAFVETDIYISPALLKEYPTLSSNDTVSPKVFRTEIEITKIGKDPRSVKGEGERRVRRSQQG